MHQRVGQKVDQKRNPEWQQKIQRKGTGCHCQIVIKSYPHMPIVLGCYVSDHNHELGEGNMIYTCLSDRAQQQMKSLLMRKVAPQEIIHTYWILIGEVAKGLNRSR